jgi:molybdenum cofactor guanylyltransferase
MWQMTMPDNVGVILAGGRSSRMGANKAEMILEGEPLLVRVVRRLSPAVDDLLIIGPQSLESLAPQVRVIGDAVPAIGPLGGLYTALRSTTSARVVLAACDMPFIRSGLVRAMLTLAEEHQEVDAVVLRANERIQPLHAVYSRRCQPMVERALAAKDHSLHALLARLTIKEVDTETVRREDPDGLSAFNANTPDEWQHALRLALAEDVHQRHQSTGDQ